MPKLDKTGPQGKGPKTGRGLGSCNDGADKQQERPGRGFGFGRGCGRRGWGFGFGRGRQVDPNADQKMVGQPTENETEELAEK